MSTLDLQAPRPTVPASLPRAGAVPLAHWGLIEARGADAASFLQGQLTNDVLGLDASTWRLAGYCSAKGRLLATFVVWRPAPDLLLLACSADILEATLKRLRMFVLRAKCKLENVSASYRLQGLWGTAVGDAVRHARPGAVLQPMNASPQTSAVMLRLQDVAGVARAWSVSPLTAEANGAGQDADLGAAAMNAWRWMEVASGVPRITTATMDAFVPQMVNLELLGGVNFRKGCYPGQEVVARSQYRGTLKRRMHAFAGRADASPGQEMFHAQDADQPAGTVVDAAPWDGESLALVSWKTALRSPDGRSNLHVGAHDGATLHEVGMPYDVPEGAEDPA